MVHSYPHVKLGSPLFPRRFRDIASLHINAEWGMGRGGGPKAATNLIVESDGLAKSQCVANVAFDIWADLDPVLASNESAAGIEIMVWLGAFGPVQPLGWDNKTSRSRPQFRLGDNNLCVYIDQSLHPSGRPADVGYISTLFEGSASVGRSTFTWMPDTNYTHISQDLSPLVQYLWKNNLVPAEAYVGTVGFGSESFFSLDPITFTARSLSLNVTSEGVAPVFTCDAQAGKHRPASLLSFLLSFVITMVAYGLL